MKKLSLISFLLLSSFCFGQKWFEPADSLKKNRAILALGTEGAAFATTVSGLQFAWYNQYQGSGFHFFNDWKGWMQMDKAGHTATSYLAAYNLHKINRWAGIKEKKSVWMAVGLSYSFQLAVEVMDGFSTGWGFSNYDMLFNTAGSSLFLGQQLGWKEQRIKMKFSFWPSGLTDLKGVEGDRARNLYGASIYEQWLKEYNGQTYWLSANIWSLAGKPQKFPKWLNVAVGYSVDGLLGAERNSWKMEDQAVETVSLIPRERQFLLSLDVDLEHVKLPKALIWVKPIFGIVKFPFPALEWNSNKGLIFNPLYF